LKVAVIGQDGWHTRDLQAALARRGVAAPCLRVTRLEARLGAGPKVAVEGEALDGYDAVFLRALPGGSLEQIVYRMDALRRLENLGVRVLNPARSIEHGVDKYYTASLLEDAGVPTPRTIVTERFDEALAALDELGGDVIVKPLFGSEGRGMVRVSDPDLAYRVFRALELSRYVFCVQEFISPGGRDIRAFVVGDHVIGGMVRQGRGWKSNMSQGGTATPLVPESQAAEMALAAVRAVGADYGGVDLLPKEGGGYSVLEVNTIPGWRGLREATGIDVAQLVVDYALREEE